MMGSRAWRALLRRDILYRRRNIVGSVRLTFAIAEALSSCYYLLTYYLCLSIYLRYHSSLYDPFIIKLFEFFLPIVFVGFLVLIKSAVENSDSFAPEFVEANLPVGNDAFKIFSFTDYVISFQADRKCAPAGSAPWLTGGASDDGSSSSGLGITGIFNAGYNWQVPFVKCDSRLCTTDGENAFPFCEYLALGVAPSTEDDTVGLEQAKAFERYIYDRYPVLLDKAAMPFDFDFVQTFPSNQALESYVQSPEYVNPKLALGVVFDGLSDPMINYNYQLRVNSTGFNSPEQEGRPATVTTPPTDALFESFARTDSESCFDAVGGTPTSGQYSQSCTGKYIYNGALTIQRLVHDFILQDSGAVDAGYFVADHGVQYVPFPTEPYTENGFYATISGFAPLLITLVSFNLTGVSLCCCL
jgi:hypothetical protein